MSLFDPLGTAAPLVVKAKIRLRALGLRGLRWSEVIEKEDAQWWCEWFDTLNQLNFLEIPRCLFPKEVDQVRIELHTFCDASEEAFAAVVYTRSVYRDGSVIIRHVKAATKLSPMKTLSIPKLELNAAVLGARLARFVQESLTRRVDRRYFWTDSSTVRNWVRATASTYLVFVSHRIGEIQSVTQPEEWRFVPGRCNPADAATRSLLESEAIPFSWLDGPEFLNYSDEQWPTDLPWKRVNEELRPVRTHTLQALPTFDWSAVTITAADIPELVKFQGQHRDWLRRAQGEVYHQEIEALRKGKPIAPSSALIRFTPVLDKTGIVRLGGRLRHADLPYDSKHPPLLPGRHPFSMKVIVAFHERLGHYGTDLVLSHVQRHLWVTNGREAVKKVRRFCSYCIRERAKPVEQLMGDLPDSRLAAGEPPFSRTACDYFGPLETASARNRVNKRWGALFTCLVTRAVYIDVANSLSADDFLLILRRFIAIYGKPKRIHSDNGTNFVGGERLLREEVEALHAADAAHSFFRVEAIEWRFQPAKTPHFGGAHESLVRSTKRALYAALDTEKKCLRYPTDDMLRTLLFEVASLLNSRPLTYVSADPSDIRPLTPNDFMNRPPAADIPTGECTDALPRERFRYVQRTASVFWSLWRRVYLQTLVTRNKWQYAQRNLQVGDFVLEIDRHARRGEWRTGKVVAVFPGADGLVRAVDVQNENGVYRRGVNQLCLLDQGSSTPARMDSGENVDAKATPGDKA